MRAIRGADRTLRAAGFRNLSSRVAVSDSTCRVAAMNHKDWGKQINFLLITGYYIQGCVTAD